ncbi:hypothetical protein [Occallatibacter riparius]|uniref:Uncharacterized protein n=1 Tax=Occallatibacter riparius TaxID=1002689 RepID=A0A9J7BQ21_9BACT|nr:hypothetical protein [Occallatibacter riparius]UWZ84641.1 hypothetical protein MOP44_01600 [Occallatibacter riparius]
MQNWKTTIIGLAMGGLQAAATYQGSGGWKGYGIAIGIALIGILARDFNVTLSDAELASIKNFMNSGGKVAGLDDPAHKPCPMPPDGNAAQKLGVLMLCALLLQATLFTGCTKAQAAQDIVNWMPALQNAVHVVDATAAVLDPAAAPILAAATKGFDAGAQLVVAQAQAYLASPSVSVLAQLQAAVVTLQQSVNQAVLEAARIVNPQSQQKALVDIAAVATIVNTVLALVNGMIGPSAAKSANAAAIKVAQVTGYLDQDKAARLIAEHYRISNEAARVEYRAGLQELAQAGF